MSIGIYIYSIFPEIRNDAVCFLIMAFIKALKGYVLTIFYMITLHLR